jgi:hypothetical protein
MLQQYKQQLEKQNAKPLLATRSLCVSEALWNLSFVAVQISCLPYLPRMYARILPASLAWFAWLTVLTFGLVVLYKVALAARWLWRIKYLTQPTHVEPTHWQDQFPFTRKRLIGRTVAAILGFLLFLAAIINQVFSPLVLGYYLAVPLMIISVIAGWKHMRGK